MKFSMDSVLSKRTLRLLTARERDCGIVKLTGIDGSGGEFLSCSGQHCFCLFTI